MSIADGIEALISALKRTFGGSGDSRRRENENPPAPSTATGRRMVCLKPDLAPIVSVSRTVPGRGSFAYAPGGRMWKSVNVGRTSTSVVGGCDMISLSPSKLLVPPDLARQYGWYPQRDGQCTLQKLWERALSHPEIGSDIPKARSDLLVPVYTKLVSELPAYAALKILVATGQPIVLLAPHAPEYPMPVNLTRLRRAFEYDTFDGKPVGHAYVLGAMLAGIDHDDYLRAHVDPPEKQYVEVQR